MAFLVAGVAIFVAISLLSTSSSESNKGRVADQPTPQRQNSAPILEPELKGGKWKLAKDKSGFDDSTTVVVSVESDDTLTGWPGRTANPALVLRCMEGKTDAYIKTGMPGRIAFGEYGSDEGTEMRMRYDKGEVFEYRMPASTDKEAYFFRQPIPEIKYMLKHERLLVEFCPFNSSPQEFRFDLRKLGEVISDLRSICKW